MTSQDDRILVRFGCLQILPSFLSTWSCDQSENLSFTFVSMKKKCCSAPTWAFSVIPLRICIWLFLSIFLNFLVLYATPPLLFKTLFFSTKLVFLFWLTLVSSVRNSCSSETSEEILTFLRPVSMCSLILSWIFFVRLSCNLGWNSSVALTEAAMCTILTLICNS